MNCPQCGSINLNSAKVCIRCKSPLTSSSSTQTQSSSNHCPNCGAINLRSATTCIRCKKPLQSQGTLPTISPDNSGQASPDRGTQPLTEKADDDRRGFTYSNICLNCGMKNKDEASFCISCGQPLTKGKKLKCANCGEMLLPSVEFCSACGNKFNRTNDPSLEISSNTELNHNIGDRSLFIQYTQAFGFSKKINNPKTPYTTVVGDWTFYLTLKNVGSAIIVLNLSNTQDVLDKKTGMVCGVWVQPEIDIVVIALRTKVYFIYLVGRIDKNENQINGLILNDKREEIGVWNAQNNIKTPIFQSIAILEEFINSKSDIGDISINTGRSNRSRLIPTPDRKIKYSAIIDNLKTNYTTLVGHWTLNITINNTEPTFIVLFLSENQDVIDKNTGGICGGWIQPEVDWVVITLRLSEQIIYLDGESNVNGDWINGTVLNRDEQEIGVWDAQRNLPSSLFQSASAVGRMINSSMNISDIKKRSGTKVPTLVLNLTNAVDGRRARVEKQFDLACRSDHILNNPLWLDRVKSTSIYFDAADNDFNAYATDNWYEDIDVPPPLIIVLNGFYQAYRPSAISLVNSLEIGNYEPLLRCLRLTGELLQSSGQFAEENYYYVLRELYGVEPSPEIIDSSIAYFEAMLLGVISHELGHICYGHTLGNVREPDEVSRNNERDADSFASSILATLTERTHHYYGAFIVDVLMTWFEEFNQKNPRSAHTHPYSRSRVYAFVESNKEHLAKLNITPDNVDRFLPYPDTVKKN